MEALVIVVEVAATAKSNPPEPLLISNKFVPKAEAASWIVKEPMVEFKRISGEEVAPL